MSRVQKKRKDGARAERNGQAEQVERSPLYGVAMLKIAMEMKKPGTRELDDILAGVLERMRIAEPEFRAFLANNGGLLRTLAHRRRY
ncbi:MAG TPA: hypothetical protein VE618_09800 [Myxococcaceae bacterium]|nr:hypothetical protein [Myxococcaceae bacterium]